MGISILNLISDICILKLILIFLLFFMKKKYFSILFLLNSFVLVYSQQVIKDSLSLENIPFVEIYSDKGDLIGVTDKEGVLSSDLNAEIIKSNTSTVTFVHSTFKDKVLTIDWFKNNPVVILNPIVIALNEVVIVAKPNAYKYLKLKGYFRSIQIMSDIPLYYMDGIVDYYIVPDSDKVIMKIMSSRSFENKESAKLDPKYFPIIAGVPSFENFLDYKVLSSGYDLKNGEKETKLVFDKKEGIEKGFLSKANDNSVFQFELIALNNPKKAGFLGIELQYNNHIVNAVYDTNDYSNIGLDNLIYSKETKLFHYKIKKNGDLTKVDVTYEFFLLDKDFVNEKTSKGSDSFYKFKKESSHQDNYWEHINNALFQPLPKSLEKYIEANLTEMKE